MIAERATPAMAGEVIGAYRILSLLGSGGMGTVWLAEHTVLGRRVAIKLLHAEVSRDPTMVERFFAEARAATRIADPGIVVVHDVGWHPDRGAFIVMEHLGGESVAARLRGGRFSVADAVRVVQQVALAMAVAHAGGIIHRDLKPDNIFLVPDPAVATGERIKILDFGIAKLVGDSHGPVTHTRTGAIMGTPTYMSPEQCRGAGDIDHRTDVYALGCVLFYLLCGRLPFLAETAGDMIAAHLREDPLPPSYLIPEVPPAIDAIVLRCLAKAAADRHASMADLARELGAAMGGPAAVRPITPIAAFARGFRVPEPTQLSSSTCAAGESLVRPPPRRRAIALVVGGIAVATAALVALISVGTSPRPSPSSPSSASEAVTDAGPPVDAAVVAPVDARADAAPPPATTRKPRPRPPRPPKSAPAPAPAPRCDDDPYACP